MDKENKPKSYEKRLDYDDIYALYELTDSPKKKTIGERLKNRLESYLAQKEDNVNKFEDLSEQEQAYFVCYVIKDLMLKLYCDKSSYKKIEQNLEKRIEKSGLADNMVITEHNNRMDNLFLTKSIKNGRSRKATKKNFDKRYDDYEKQRFYDEFCKEWCKSRKDTPPDFETFCEYPYMSPYDWMMTELQEREFRVPQDRIDRFVFRIILEILEERFNLRIDYDGIEDCLEKAYYPKDTELEDYINEFYLDGFPLKFEEYADTKECTEEEIEKLRLEYEGAKKRFAERERAFDKLSNLKNFYTIDKIENKKK